MEISTDFNNQKQQQQKLVGAKFIPVLSGNPGDINLTKMKLFQKTYHSSIDIFFYPTFFIFFCPKSRYQSGTDVLMHNAKIINTFKWKNY